MGMSLSLSAGSGLLHVDAAGDFSIEEAKRTFLEVLLAVERRGAARILFDGRELEGEPEDLERFIYGDWAANAVREYTERAGVHPPQFAYILRLPLLDPRRFGETVAVNRGMHVRAFDNIQEGVAWLMLTPEKRQPGTPGGLGPDWPASGSRVSFRSRSHP